MTSSSDVLSSYTADKSQPVVPPPDLPNVAHICDKFLPVSETFIYQSLQNMRRVHPIAIYSKRENEHLFPMVSHSVHEVPDQSRYSIEGIQALVMRETGIDPTANRLASNYYHLLSKLKPRLVHAHFGPQGVRVARPANRLKLPLVVSFYGYDLSSLVLEKRWKRAYRAMFAYAQAVIALSENFRARLEAQGCPPEKIHIIRLGVDPDHFTFRMPPAELPNPVRLLGVGRCVEKKGTGFALEALALVRQKFPNIVYTHIGDGALLSDLKEQARYLGVDDICEWTGNQSRDFVRQAMHDSHLFVLPSVRATNGDEEGTPTVLYEAMSVGLPILSTRHSGIPEVVREGEHGYLSPEKDSEALATNILKMIANVAQWPQMATAGRCRIETEFDVRNETAKLEAIYFSLMK